MIDSSIAMIVGSAIAWGKECSGWVGHRGLFDACGSDVSLICGLRREHRS